MNSWRVDGVLQERLEMKELRGHIPPMRVARNTLLIVVYRKPILIVALSFRVPSSFFSLLREGFDNLVGVHELFYCVHQLLEGKRGSLNKICHEGLCGHTMLRKSNNHYKKKGI
jgi:hypothetical protein